MQFGADMKVVWPQNLKENIKNEIKGLKQLYCIDQALFYRINLQKLKYKIYNFC